MQIAATTVSYRDVLKNTAASPAAGAATLDARVRAWEGVKARQVLIDASAPNQPLHQAASNQQLVSLANNALCGMEDPPPHCFVGARRLNNGGLLLEMDSEEAAAWISGPHVKASFLHRFVPNATFKSCMLRVVQATRVLWKLRPEIRKFGGFLEMASAHALHLPSVASRVFRMEVGTGFRNVSEQRYVPE